MPTDTALPEQFGRYRILRKLGAGGMGAVYLAEDTMLGRQVALKVPHFEEGASATIIERFYREARAAAAIDHPNLCPVYDVGEVNGIHYLTMPLIEGKPLSDLVSSSKPWPARQAAELVSRAAAALHVLHEMGFVHRDLKPGNIMLRPSGEPVVMDFGLARSFASDSQHLTATGAIVGTPAYMSPEQVMGDPEAIGPATDIYGLGVILYHLVTGRVPFLGPGNEVFGQILHATPEAPSARRPELAHGINAICLKAMAKKPADRYRSMTEFASALEGYVRQPADSLVEPVGGTHPGVPDTVPPRRPGDTIPTTQPREPPVVGRPKPGRQSRRFVFLGLLFLFLVLAGAATMLFLQWQEGIKIKAAKGYLKQLSVACQRYHLKNEEWPASLDELTRVQPSGHGPFLKPDALLDPWGNEYGYDRTGPNNGGKKPDIWFTGPDGVKHGNWPGGN